MIPVRLNEEWSRHLAKLPETSMGSQHVDVILKKGRVIKDVVIFNAEEGQSPEPFDPADIADIRLSSR
jgi:hypothetical protein